LHTITIEVAHLTDVTNLIPTIYVSNGASISPDSKIAQDFTLPVEYVVTAQDGTTTQTWTVTVIVSAVSVIDQDASKELIIYPNPARSSFYIETNFCRNVKIIDISGKLVLEQASNSDLTEIKHDLGSGLYFVLVEKEDSTVIIGKLIVQY
jgi:hypothetical protein